MCKEYRSLQSVTRLMLTALRQSVAFAQIGWNLTGLGALAVRKRLRVIRNGVSSTSNIIFRQTLPSGPIIQSFRGKIHRNSIRIPPNPTSRTLWVIIGFTLKNPGFSTLHGSLTSWLGGLACSEHVYVPETRLKDHLAPFVLRNFDYFAPGSRTTTPELDEIAKIPVLSQNPIGSLLCVL